MATYGKKASDKVEKAMHERKHGTLKSGGSGKKVTSRKQAIAIGLSEARAKAARCRQRRRGESSGKKTAAKKRRKETGAESRKKPRAQDAPQDRARKTGAQVGGEEVAARATEGRRGYRSPASSRDSRPRPPASVAERQAAVAARIVGAVEAVLADRLAAERSARRPGSPRRGWPAAAARTRGPCPRGSCACRG